MVKIGQPFTSGRWLVKADEEAEFIKRWKTFTEWAANEADGAEEFYLIQDTKNQQRFMSFGAWRDMDSVNAWRQRPEFADYLGKCREVCEDFQPSDFVLKAGSSES